MNDPQLRGPTQRGLTLIELMVAVGVVGVLMAVAYPSYQEVVRSTRRADAQTVLMEASHYMERFATENLRYDKTIAGVAVQLPTQLTKSPKGGSNTSYEVSLLSVNRETYTLRAVPVGAQASDVCATMTVDQAGTKSAARSDCWRR